ncbi:DUF3231 family protein [Bacillus benzoevorans]|uniref:DUF3231 family protein n=1 Tax=Bacillus benzoevorans TaxID=1456 RepID=A0A7X0HVR4_9BACI|nr:hypothetical protein [Bacillus benzoevorans]
MEKNNRRLTSAEITNLITQFEQETMSVCVGKYVLATVKDAQIHSLYQRSLEISEKHLKKMKELFKTEKFPVPHGLTEEDVNLEAPPLFTDSFWLEYLYSLIHIGLSGYSLSLSISVRRDIRDYYYQCNLEAMDLYNKITDLLLEKGNFEPPPYFAVPKKVEYIKGLGYTLNVLGKKRPLNVAEAGNVYVNLTMTRLAKGLCLGFHQVVRSQEVKEFLEEVIKVINKNYGIFSKVLTENNLQSPSLLDTQVTKSTIPPFSDRLMMLKTGFLLGASLSYYGTALVASLRVDLISHCEAAILRGLKLMPSWGSIAIRNQWIEKLPEADDRADIPLDRKEG